MAKSIDVSGGKTRASNDGAHVLLTRRFVRISHHRHTGRYLPLHYTSYAFVFFLLVLLGCTLLFARNSVVNAGPPQTQNGSITLNGVVPGPPPGNAPTVNQPTETQRFSSPLITVSGVCDTGYIIEVYRNGVLAGSDMCVSNQYEIPITLVKGDNQLVVRIKDSIGQYGPDSPAVTVFYDAPPEIIDQGGSVGVDTSGDDANADDNSGKITYKQLMLTTKSLHTGGLVGRSTKVIYNIDGGVKPYAVSVDWDDEQDNTLTPVKRSGQITAKHTYTQPGQYTVTFFATDSKGNVAQIQTIVLVSGTGTTAGGSGATGATTDCSQKPNAAQCLIRTQLLKGIDVVWPAFIVASLMGASFWLGEKAMIFSLGKVVTRT